MRLTLKGPCALYSGYGKVFLGVARRLRERMPVELLALNNQLVPGYPLPIDEVPHNCWLGIIIGHPPTVLQLPTQRKVLYTMYEASDIPDEWKTYLYRADEVWVPSRFCQEVFGAYVQARVVPIGFEETAYRREPWSAEQRDRFWSLFCPEAVGKRVVGTAGVMSKRKGVDLLVRGFALADMPDTVLVIKTRDTRWMPERLPENLFVLGVDWPDEALADFYRSLDLFVLPTRGEGFGLPPLEAVACGTPALVTRATGCLEYIDDRGVYGIEVGSPSRAESMTVSAAEWENPLLDDLVDKMRDLVYHPRRPEHGYRQHSMSAAVDKWEAEIKAAYGRTLP